MALSRNSTLIQIIKTNTRLKYPNTALKLLYSCTASIQFLTLIIHTHSLETFSFV